jgi:hypothetical protein
MCVPPQYKYHKVVVHFTTWASWPSTTKRWLTTGYLGGDHTFYTNFHEHVHGWGCRHVRSHAVDLFIINACHVGSHQTIGVIVDCSLFVITLRAPLSMDMVGEHLECLTFTDASKDLER